MWDHGESQPECTGLVTLRLLLTDLLSPSRETLDIRVFLRAGAWLTSCKVQKHKKLDSYLNMSKTKVKGQVRTGKAICNNVDAIIGR